MFAYFTLGLAAGFLLPRGTQVMEVDLFLDHDGRDDLALPERWTFENLIFPRTKKRIQTQGNSTFVTLGIVFLYFIVFC